MTRTASAVTGRGSARIRRRPMPVPRASALQVPPLRARTVSRRRA
ncbi:hypothetical protein [Streptomyces platensis]